MDLTDGASLKLAAAGPSALARSPKAHLPVDQFTNVNSLGISSYPPNMLKTKPLKQVSRNHRFSKSVIMTHGLANWLLPGLRAGR